MPKRGLKRIMVSWDVPEGLKAHVEETVEVTFLIFESEPPVFVVCALQYDILKGVIRIILLSWNLCRHIDGRCILAIMF
jgi:hypothetical protein